MLSQRIKKDFSSLGVGDSLQDVHRLRRRVLFKVQGKISTPSDRTQQRNCNDLINKASTLSGGGSQSPGKTLNTNISDTLDMSPEKDEIFNIVQSKIAGETEQRAQVIMTKIEEMIGNNDKLLQPLEQRIEKEINKRMGKSLLSKDLKELVEKGKAAKNEHERYLEETRKIIMSRWKNRKINGNMRSVPPKTYKLDCS